MTKDELLKKAEKLSDADRKALWHDLGKTLHHSDTATAQPQDGSGNHVPTPPTKPTPTPTPTPSQSA